MLLKETLTKNWEKIFGFGRSRDFCIVKIGGRPGRYTNDTFFVSEEGFAAPRYLIKINRDASFEQAIDEEGKNYEAIWKRLRGSGVRTADFISFVDLEGHRLLCKEYIAGKRFDLSGDAALGRFIKESMRWLASFHEATRKGYREIDGILLEKIRKSFDAMAEKGVLKKELAGRYVEALPVLKGERLPDSASHGDYTHFNILITDSGTIPVDWEDCLAESSGEKVLDDIYFLISQLLFDMDSALSGMARLTSLLEGSSDVGRAITESLKRYTECVGVNLRSIVLLYPYFICRLLEEKERPHRSFATYIFRDPVFLKDVTEVSLGLAEKL